MSLKPHGELTAEIGKSLKFEDYDVYYDHGTSSENVGRIISYFGSKNAQGTQLSYLDIAIVEKNSNKVFALIEIEETSDKPKTLLGDIFGVLLGEHITFQGKSLDVGEWTTLIIFGFANMLHHERRQYILEKVEKIKAAMDSGNSKIGQVVIEDFSDGKSLLESIPAMLDKLLRGEL